MRKPIFLLMLVALILASCNVPGQTSPNTADEKTNQAQQTLDALNAGANNPDPTNTSAPPAADSGGNDPAPATDTEAPAPTDTDVPPPTDTSVPPTATHTAVPQPDINYEFDDEAWEEGFTSNCGPIHQPMSEFGSGWQEDDHLFGAGPGCSIAFKINLPSAGTYSVFLAATYAPDFGKLKLTFSEDGDQFPIFDIDLFGNSVTPTGEIPLGNWSFLGDSEVFFIVTTIGKNSASTAEKFGLDYLHFYKIKRGP